MLTGLKGVKYGLQKPSRPGAKPSGAAKPKASLAAFAQQDDSDDSDDINVQLRRQQAHKAKQAKWEQQRAQALAQDASVFDYDGVYDEIQTAREKPKQAEKAQRQSRYINNLLDKAKERKKEQDILYERQLERERKVEDEVYGDKGKFVTSAYKKKLEEDRMWLEAEKQKEEMETKNDVTKRDGLGDFYRNLHRNAAFGGSRFAQVHASEEQRKEEDNIRNPTAEGEEAEAAAQTAKGCEGRNATGAAQPAAQEEQPAESGQPAEPNTAEPTATHDAGDDTPNTAEAAAKAAPPAAAASLAGKRRNKEEAVAAARERYLARKKARG